MTHNPNLLFVYGTLLITNNTFGAYLQSHCRLLTKGRVKGILYDAGEYPGAIINNSGNYIYGHIYSINKPDNVLPILDDYEGISINEPLPHEYLRLLIPVETDAGMINCWMYVYNWPVDGLKVIDGGDYLVYKSASSL
ncbi:gamma-glutamylcyclotransferase [Mucilaginibacter sp. UR6-1]|uniref:gamma-glutamylcyclotransferase family protein n=1 Tax=Mucilaginibacter sp. UR6-1 TaxID=1435643 RepID=UPI001E366B3F|nr:gamma-glutamylcyclotransferase family protein [Mucilaginibacter sp. UR6-1]MCC8410080.1 gamma-glutamylcyclotransferase [Mucilaginibacter sp. UR6-1]